MRINLLLISVCLTAILLGNGAFADEDPVAEILNRANSQSATPELHEEIDQVIRSNPGNPNIDSLRLARLRGLTVLYSNKRDIIKEYETFIQEVGASTEIGFKAQKDVGYLLHHYISDKKAAFEHYKSMESNPILQGEDLQSEYKRVEVYTRIAQSAYGTYSMPDQVDKYARLVMTYPYLGMEDREMYRKFYQLYADAATCFLLEFRNDPKQLMSIEIYPSQPDVYDMRVEFLRRLLVPEDFAAIIHSDIDLALDTVKTESVPVESTKTVLSDDMKISPTAPTGANIGDSEL